MLGLVLELTASSFMERNCNTNNKLLRFNSITLSQGSERDIPPLAVAVTGYNLLSHQVPMIFQ